MKTVAMSMKKGTRRAAGVILAGVMLLTMGGCKSASDSSGEAQSAASSQAEQTQERAGQTEERVEQTQKTAEQTQKPVLDEKKQAAVNHLLTVWTDYLQTMDKLYGSELWALDYTDAFLESSDWSDLSRARTACIASARYLSELTMTEKDLTDEEYLTLAQAGIDSAYQSYEFQSVQTSAEDARQEVRDHLLEALENDIFMKSGMDTLKDRAEACRDSITYMCQYYCATTNYLLLTLNDEKVAGDYWKTMQSSFPVLTGAGLEWMDEEDGLKKTTDKILDALEEIEGRQADIRSKTSADLYNMGQLIDKKDLDGLAASANSISGAPALLPAPDWYQPEHAKYLSYVQKEGGDISYPESGDDLTEDVYSVYFQVEQVSREEIREYVNLAAGIGNNAWEKDDNSWYIAMPDYNIGLAYEDSCVTITIVGQDITFAPAWYLMALGK